MSKFIPYGRQSIDADDVKAIEKALQADYLTTGPSVRAFEQELAEKTGSKRAVSVTNGTAALELAVQCLDLPEGSEIITTPLTFVADANAALFNQCIPVFADIKQDTFNIDPESVRAKITDKTKAIISVDYAGLPCDNTELARIADEHDLVWIEDGCHALGATYSNDPVGTIADLTCFSFHPVKHITTAGEGGAITTNNEAYADTMERLRTHGMNKDSHDRSSGKPSYRYDITALSRNFRLTDVQCAVGTSQLKKLDAFLKKRQQVAEMYDDAFSGVQGLHTQPVPPDRTHAYHLYPILVPEEVDRDAFFVAMRNQNIGVNVHYVPIYQFTLYKRLFAIDPADYPSTESVFSRLISLPMHPSLTEKEVERVIDTTIKTIKELRHN